MNLDNKEEPKWHSQVQEIPHVDGYKYPVFLCSFGFKEGIRAGEVQVWPIHGIFVIKSRREEDGFNVCSIKEAKAVIREIFGFMPPYLEKVWKSIQKFPRPDCLNDVLKMSIKLKQEWDKMLQSETD